MTITTDQIKASLAQLQTLRTDIASLISASREDSTAQGVWIEGTSIASDQTRVVAGQNSLLTTVKNDAAALQ